MPEVERLGNLRGPTGPPGPPGGGYVSGVAIAGTIGDGETIWSMQTDANWSNITSGSQHPVLRGSGATMTAHGTTPNRELRIPTRGGSSQGPRLRADWLFSQLPTGAPSLRLQYNGVLSVPGATQVRVESAQSNIWTSPTGSGNAFSHEIVLTRAVLSAAAAATNRDITLGATPNNAGLTITDLIIYLPAMDDPAPLINLGYTPSMITVQSQGTGTHPMPAQGTLINRATAPIIQPTLTGNVIAGDITREATGFRIRAQSGLGEFDYVAWP